MHQVELRGGFLAFTSERLTNVERVNVFLEPISWTWKASRVYKEPKSIETDFSRGQDTFFTLNK